MNVSLTPDGRWRRRYLALYPISEENTKEEGVDTNTIKDINRPQILIFPRQSAKIATARIRLTSSHGIQYEGVTIFGTDSEEKLKNLIFTKDDNEIKNNEYTFKLVKRNLEFIFASVSLVPRLLSYVCAPNCHSLMNLHRVDDKSIGISMKKGTLS